MSEFERDLAGGLVTGAFLWAVLFAFATAGRFLF
jgi:hypothetical protein